MENSEPKVKAPKSAHIIDLRQSGGGASAKPASSDQPALAAAKPAPRRRRRVATSAPAPAPSEKSSVAASSAPVAEPLSPSDSAPTDFSASAAPNRRRFWPAFWRFLVLLIVLGLVVGGGLYIYTHYYAT